MAQAQSTSIKSIKVKNMAVVVAAAGNTTLLTAIVERMSRFGFEMVVAGVALDAFQVSARAHPDAPFFILSSAITSTPSGLFLFATGTLATQGIGTGAFIMDCTGMYEIKVEASANASPATVDAYALANSL